MQSVETRYDRHMRKACGSAWSAPSCSVGRVWLAAFFVLLIAGQSVAAVSSVTPRLVAISVSNLERSAGWYAKTFGFRELRHLDLPQNALRISFLELNRFQLELVEFRNSVSFDAIHEKFPNLDDRAKVQGFTKLAFGVRDIRRAASDLEASGAKFIRKVTKDETTGEEWLIIEDPDGNWIQLFGSKR